MSQSRTYVPRSQATGRGRTRSMLLLGVSLLVGLAVLAYGLFVAKGHAYTADETRVLAQLAASRVPAMVDVSLAINWLFSPPIAVIVGAVTAATVYASTRRWSATFHFVTLVLVTWLSSEVVKVIVHRPRPVARVAETLVANPDPDSYPSGHVCFAVGLGFAIVVLIANRRAKTIVAIIATLLAVVTASSRIYLGIHYPTDAIASLVLAAAAFVAAQTLWTRYLPDGRVGSRHGTEVDATAVKQVRRAGRSPSTADADRSYFSPNSRR